MAPLFPLVVVVYADAELRVARLVEQRGMAEDDARARIAAQAADDQRRAVADVWLDNSSTPEALAERAREVWDQPHHAVRRQSQRWPSCSPSCPAGARGSGLVRSGCAHPRPPQGRVWGKGVARRPHRFHRGSRTGREGCHRHSGHRRIPRGGRRTRRRLTVGRLSTHRRRQQRRRQARRPQHRRTLRPQWRSDVVAQAASRVGGSRTPDIRPSAGGQLAQSAIRPAVRRLAESQSRSPRRVPGRQTPCGAGSIPGRRHRTLSGRQGAMVPRRHTAGRGTGPTDQVGGRRPRDWGAGRRRAVRRSSGRCCLAAGWTN